MRQLVGCPHYYSCGVDFLGRDHFADIIGAVQFIFTNTGQNDSGILDTHLRYERFLPFERTPALSAHGSSAYLTILVLPYYTPSRMSSSTSGFRE
jgi:hypothetical protein